MADKNDPTSLLSMFSMAGMQMPVVPTVRLPKFDINPAESAYKRISRYIREFEEQLDSEHEIGGRLVSHGSGTTFHIEDIGYHGPDLVTFYGIDEEGQRLQLIQHISQINILLVAVRKTGEKARRIGFKLGTEESGAEPDTTG